MQINTMDGFNAVCEAKGVKRDVSLFMMQDEKLKPGDFVLVHVGYAIQTIAADEASYTWELLDEVLAQDA
jgi:hydrogenase expression/formation protein HypC